MPALYLTHVINNQPTWAMSIKTTESSQAWQHKTEKSKSEITPTDPAHITSQVST